MPQLADPLEIVLKVTGEQQVEKLTADVNRQTDSLKKLNDQFKAGAISQQQFNVQSESLARGIARSNLEIDTIHANLSKLSTVSNKSAQGLLQLGYAADDIQYGFRAIVNNIPGIVMGLGGSMGLAGAAAVAAVSVNQLISKWEEIMDLFSNSKGIDAAKSNLESLIDMLKNTGFEDLGFVDFLKLWQEGPAVAGEKNRTMAVEAARAKSGEKTLEAAKSEDETKRGALFKKALGEYGGDRLFNEMLSKEIAGRNLTPSQIEFAKENVRRQVEQGASGKVDAKGLKGSFGQAFSDTFGQQVDKENAKKSKQLMAKEEHATDKTIKEDEDEHKRQLKTQEHAAKGEEDMKKALFDMRKENEEGKLAIKIEAKEKQLDDMEKNKSSFSSQVISGTHAFSNQMMTQSIDAIPKQQLKAMDAIKAEIKGLRKDMQMVRGMKFENN